MKSIFMQLHKRMTTETNEKEIVFVGVFLFVSFLCCQGCEEVDTVHVDVLFLNLTENLS